MATGRTTPRHLRVYLDGYDMSGYGMAVGPLTWEFENEPMRAFTDEVKSVINGQATLGLGTLNGILDNTASGLHELASASYQKRVAMVAVGIRGAPAQGDPVYIGEFEQSGYTAVPAGAGFVAANVPFENASVLAAHLLHTKPWGWLLHPKGAETAVNTAVGIDDNGAASARGGVMCYQIFSSNGTVTVKVQDAATNANGSFSDLSGATSGSVDASSTPKSGIVAIGTTATVRRYLRWQVVLGTATTVTFALGFVRS